MPLLSLGSVDVYLNFILTLFHYLPWLVKKTKGVGAMNSLLILGVDA